MAAAGGCPATAPAAGVAVGTVLGCGTLGWAACHVGLNVAGIEP